MRIVCGNTSRASTWIGRGWRKCVVADDGYRSGVTIGSKWGCVATILVGCPLLFLSLLVGAIGDCAPDSRCASQSVVFVILLPIGIAALVGLAARWLINRLVARRDDGKVEAP